MFGNIKLDDGLCVCLVEIAQDIWIEIESKNIEMHEAGAIWLFLISLLIGSCIRRSLVGYGRLDGV